MPKVDPADSFYPNITVIDVRLAEAYYPILIDLAKQGLRFTYSDLIAKAKEIYPTKTEVQRALPVSTGRRLRVIRLFTNKHDMPDLTSLIINKATDECGEGFTQYYDPEDTRKKVFAFDWSTVSTEFDFSEPSPAAITPRKRNKKH